jgi:hypothetical protein
VVSGHFNKAASGFVTKEELFDEKNPKADIIMSL